MTHLKLKPLSVVFACALLAACEGTVPSKDGGDGAPVEDGTTTGGTGTTTGVTGVGGFQGDPLDDPSSMLATRVFYFDYDEASIKPTDRVVIEAHARYLAANTHRQVTLFGHADERGSREYNMALGERRGNAVRRLMTLLGASDGQIRVVSYGEESPADPGHHERAWAANRRVELDYGNR